MGQRDEVVARWLVWVEFVGGMEEGRGCGLLAGTLLNDHRIKRGDAADLNTRNHQHEHRTVQTPSHPQPTMATPHEQNHALSTTQTANKQT